MPARRVTHDVLYGPLSASATAWCGFDAHWYRTAYAAAIGDLDDDAAALRHYLATGRRMGLAPNMFIDEAWYCRRHLDVAAAVAAGDYTSGYEHYCTVGYLTRSPHWLYDDDTYALHSPDLTDHVLVTFGCANRYDHYLKAGAREQRVAHLMFQPARYCAAMAPQGVETPFVHYLDRLWRHAGDADCSPYFDAAWYLRSYPAVRAAIAAGHYLGALHHFLAAPEPGDPLPCFDTAFYARSEPAASRAVAAGTCISPYDHFLKAGVYALAAPAPGVGLAAYLAEHPDARRAIEAGDVRDIFAHYAAAHPSPAEIVLAVEHVTPVEPAPRRDAPPLPDAEPTSTDLHLEFDATILCPPDGLVVVGWLLAPPGYVAALNLVCGATSVPIDLARTVSCARPDVQAAYQHEGYDDPQCGFIAFVEGRFAPGEPIYVEIELSNGGSALRQVPAPLLHGMPAIRAVLDRFDLRYAALEAALANVVAPAIDRLGAAFIAQPVPREVIGFGTGPARPDISLIVPLHGRLDFMEVQLALFTRGGAAMAHEIIYVLDDPPRRREAEVLAASCFARFGIPFRLVMLGRNVGYAMANNIGLELATCRHVALVNSDVFPADADGFDRLAARLDADTSLGAVGPLLLFEDGAVQHQGMVFERLPAFAGLHFPQHSRKGLLPPGDDGLHRVAAITGACMMLPRALLHDLGGLDARFLIGDFEDADLCLKIAAAGRGIAVDHGVRMHHLERQSQAGSEQRWRMNLTLYNAWTHEQRWGATLAGMTR